jgi:tetratricopeptide (TPR) repeat protein
VSQIKVDANECACRYAFIVELVKQNRLALAALECKKLNDDHPQFFEGWYLAGRVALQCGDAGNALSAIDVALEYAPDHMDSLVLKCEVLRTLNRVDDAVQLAGRTAALSLAVENQASAAAKASVLTNLACLLVACHEYHAALPLARKAVELDANTALHHVNLAAVLRFLGEREEAESALDHAILLDPHDGESYGMRSSLRKQTPSANHVEQLQSYLSGGSGGWRTRVHVHYALAKEYEDLESYEAAFRELKRGGDLRREHTHYEVENDISTMEQLSKTFNADLLARASGGFHTEEPIFVLGLPRTGSTLVEQILGKHSCVQAVGELNNFAAAVMRQIQASERPARVDRSQLVRQSAQLDMAELGKAYLDSTRPFTGKRPHFVDKMPLNFLYCGLIKLALPRARIIHTVRHPLDACFAIYKQMFNAAYPYSYDLDMLGRYFVAYWRLMEHWKNAMPGSIYDVVYEELVADQEGVTRRLLDHCGLSFEAECLQFHRGRDAVTTASASQVREPIHARSVGRWRCYSRQLQPLVERLQEAGIHVAHSATPS